MENDLLDFDIKITDKTKESLQKVVGHNKLLLWSFMGCWVIGLVLIITRSHTDVAGDVYGFLIITAIFFYPLLQLYNYSTSITKMLRTNDTINFEEAIQIQERVHRYIAYAFLVFAILLLINLFFN